MSNVIATTVSPSQAELEFQEKMKDRMRQAFGDLMPDSVLASIVARGIEEAFFKQREEPDQYIYGRQTKKYPSWLVEFLEKEARQQTQVAVEKWIAANQGKIAESLENVLKDGLASAMMRSFNSILATELATFRSSLDEAFRRLAQR